VFTLIWEAWVGIATGFMVLDANSAPAAERGELADSIQSHFTNPIIGDPSVVGGIGGMSWVVAMIAAAVALRRAGAGVPITALVGFAALFAAHPPPLGPPALVALAAATVLVQRRSCLIRSPAAESSMSVSSRFSRVSGRFALMTRWIAVRR
jgi:hypothetical protein